MGEWLLRVETPSDFRGWSVDDLEHLAQDIRQEIIHTTSETGGHIGASLGAVEVILALHKVFDSPRDRLVFDIGHQAYAHKLVTGRQARFSTIRQADGLSGFLKRHESPHDIWEAGHSSTSLSAALGMAVARDLQQESHHVVALVGDGALTAGMAWEALNQAGHLKTRLIVVLNDNSMSIAPNVGALSRYLTALRSRPTYQRLKQDLESVLEGVPLVGGSVRRAAERVKDSLRALVLPGNVFEELGFTYFGPLDGHSFGDLLPVLERVKTADGPVLVHVITRKGRGYHPAEKAPDKFHGPGPFDIVSGHITKKSGPPSYSQVVGETLVDLGRRDPRIIALTAAMPDSTGLDIFQRTFPQRAFDVGIAEQHAVTFAAGLAAAHERPIFLVYSTFLQRGYDQVIHDVCHQNLPVVFGVDRAGLVGADGATHQGVFDVAFLRTVPNMTVAMGKDEAETRLLLYGAFEQPGPVAVRYPRGAGRGVPLDAEPGSLLWGRAAWERHGQDAVVIGFGPIVHEALAAADDLNQRGYHIGVLNARFAKPLDTDALAEAAAEAGVLVTVEEHVAAGGFGSAVLEWAQSVGLQVPVHVLGLPDTFIDHGSPAATLHRYGLDAAGIAAHLVEWLPPRQKRA